MFETDLDKPQVATAQVSSQSRLHKGLLGLLFAGVAVALVGNMYQFAHNQRMEHELSLAQVNTQRQIAKLTETAELAIAQSQQRLELMKGDIKNEVETGAAANLRQARSEFAKGSNAIVQNVEKKHQEVTTQLSDLKRDTDTKFGQVAAVVEQTDSKVSQVSTNVEQTGTELKQVVGDLGVVSGQVATNAKELAALKELGERNYFEFDLAKSKDPIRVGDLWITLKKTDAKRNRYTLEVLADDKVVEKKDKTIHEPVQLYLSGSHQPYEIVINEVKDGEVIGYLSAPKVKIARGRTS